MSSYFATHAWLLWLLVFAIASAVEICTLTYFAAWVACAALVVSGLAWLFPGVGLEYQLALWIVLSIVFCFLWRRCFPPESKPEHEADVIGEQAVVTHVGPEGEATVLFTRPILGKISWRAHSSGPLRYEDRVEVVAVESKASGRVLQVRPVLR